ncbi:MAG TPA: hypothetical protein VMD49_07430 [Steroidobacteraceae bacterium]|nr:hypothetical protein [Steroidobacteraceae bacterium]
MHQRTLRRGAGLALAMLVALAIISCATTPRGPVVVLPNGYYLQPDQEGQSAIVKRSGGVVVSAPIAAYAVSGYIVAGALGKAPVAARLYSDLAFTGGANTRYFILDTTSGKLESGLEKGDWSKRLKALGVPSDFQIYPPLPWQQS